MKFIQLNILFLVLSACVEEKDAFISQKIKCVEDSGFTVCTDTINLNAKGFISSAILLKENYYIFLHDMTDKDKLGNQQADKLYQVSKDEFTSKQIILPKGYKQHYYRYMAIRNDSLILTSETDSISYYLNEKSLKWNEIDFAPVPIYEDNRYSVYSTCHGEFGGAVSFYDKTNRVNYDAHSQCAIVINSLNGKYYVTNYLGHMEGFSEILEIENPKNLTKRTNEDELDFYNSDLRKGTTQLLDSFNFYISSSFVHNDGLFHIFTSNDTCFIGKLNKGVLTQEFKLDVFPHFQHQIDKTGQLLTFFSKRSFKISDQFSFGLMEITNGKLKIHYVKTN